MIVAEVEADDGLAILTEDVGFADQLWNVEPILAVALMGTVDPALYQLVPDGLVEPALDGLTAKETWYCVA